MKVTESPLQAAGIVSPPPFFRQDYGLVIGLFPVH
jgi:hypothetical protein